MKMKKSDLTCSVVLLLLFIMGVAPVFGLFNNESRFVAGIPLTIVHGTVTIFLVLVLCVYTYFSAIKRWFGKED